MRWTVIACVVSIIAILPAAANADVSVTPGGQPTKIKIHAVRDNRHHHGTTPSHHAASPQDPALKPKCFFDGSATNFRCGLQTFPPGVPAQVRRKITQGDIVQAVKEIGLPSLTIRVQPGTATLVNIRTIFYAKPKPFKRNVNLLGYDIDLVAKPIKFRWFHGDGTSATSTTPGKAYPSMDVTYRYRRPAKSVRPRVDVTYRVTYRVDGGEWLTLDQTLVAQGPTAGLQVKEAVPVLTKP